MWLREYHFFSKCNFYSMIGLVVASNASGYPEALCLLGKIFPKPHFRMTSHAAALTLRGAFQDGGTPSTFFFLFLLSFFDFPVRRAYRLEGQGDDFPHRQYDDGCELKEKDDDENER